MFETEEPGIEVLPARHPGYADVGKLPSATTPDRLKKYQEFEGKNLDAVR